MFVSHFTLFSVFCIYIHIHTLDKCYNSFFWQLITELRWWSLMDVQKSQIDLLSAPYVCIFFLQSYIAFIIFFYFRCWLLNVCHEAVLSEKENISPQHQNQAMSRKEDVFDTPFSKREPKAFLKRKPLSVLNGIRIYISVLLFIWNKVKYI